MSRPISSVVRLPEFDQDLKRLCRRFSTLDADIGSFIEKPLTLFLRGEPAGGRIERVAGLDLDYPEVYIAKRIACRALKGRGADTGLRLVYAWFPKEDRIELIELFFKANQLVENKARIKRACGRKPYPASHS